METNLVFLLNNEVVSTNYNSATVLLDFIRKEKHLTGTKLVCKEGDCGACAVLVGTLSDNGVKYKSVNSCILPLQNIVGKHIVTIEGLNNNELSPIQKSFADEGASQCGFCTPGFIISTTNYFLNETKPDVSKAIDNIAGNVCRCTGYNSIKKAVTNLIDNKYLNRNLSNNKIDELIKLNILPDYFSSVQEKLESIQTKHTENFTTNNYENAISGGTDLFVQKPNDLLKSKNIFISEFNKSIFQNNDKILISASTTINELKNSELFNKYFSNLDNFYNLFASNLIRNTATIGGNIVNASPIGDSSVLFLSLNAKLLLSNGKSKREVLLKDFFKSYKKTDLEENEIIERIIIEIPKGKYFVSFEKVSKRTHLDIASVNTAINITVEENKISSVSISAGGVAPIPFYLNETSKFLTDKPISNELVKEAVNFARNEISPISDIRGTKEYKTLLLTQLLKAHFVKLFPEKITSEVIL